MNQLTLIPAAPSIDSARAVVRKPVILSQCNHILAHLRAGHTLTPAEAYERFGSLALHSRVAELRERGYNVTCTIRTGNGHRWGEYQLVRDSAA